MSMRLLAAACLLSWGLTAPTVAQELAPYSLSGQAGFNVGSTVLFTDFGVLPNTLADDGSILLQASAEPTPLLRTQAVVAPNEFGNLFGRGLISLSYQVMVSGPQALVPVKVGASGEVAASASVGASFVLQARWSLYWDQSNPVAGDEIGTPQTFGTSYAESFGQVREVSLIANLPYTVTLFVDAQVAATTPGSEVQAMAMVDPYFSLGEGVDPGLYGLVLSAGIGNAAPVPEPAAGGLMLAGLLLLGWRRARAVPPGY